jgi:uncharacterized repeat protein (TIGR03803 family)
LAGLIFDGAGNLYGTTLQGGTHGFGTVFELIPGSNGSWSEKVLHSFNNDGQDGFALWAGLTLDAAGNLYGTTYSGGTHDAGTVFELTPGTDGLWNEKVLHSFDNTDGNGPSGGVILDPAGNLYGTTFLGGALSYGTVFKLIRGTNGLWSERVLHSFLSGTDGANPQAGLIRDTAGHLYGTTLQGGGHGCSGTGCGTVFKVTP